VVWTPKFIDLSVAVDYFEIHVKNEVTSLGQNVPLACYSSLNFPDDPVCDLFVRNPGTERIDLINDTYINISDQMNRGIDLSVRYRRMLPWETDLTLDGQFTWRLQDTIALFADNEVDNSRRLGYPQFTGSVDATFHHGDWRFLFGAQLIGEQDSGIDWGSETVTIFTDKYLVSPHAKFTAFYHTSLTYDLKDNTQIIVGVSNLFDEEPPKVTTVSTGLGLYNTVGTVYYGSQYNEGFLGRRGFVRVSKKF
jgi:iron complex outermembrane recepter protein